MCTCEEGGAHLRISVWHLLMNLKNNYLLKNCWSGPIKVRILIFTMLHFFKKNKEKHLLFYTCVPRILMIWSTFFEIKSVTELFVILGHFCPLTLLTTQKIKILKKWKSSCRHYHFTHVYHKWKSYDVWFFTYGAQQTEFCPFTPLTTQKIKILKKFKTPGDIIILQKCTINDNHLMYGSWDMMHNRQIFFFVILGHILPFYPTNPKNQNFEKMKKTPRDIIILYKCIKNHDHMLYCFWDMVYDRCNFYFSFWAVFLPFYPPNSPKNQNF